MFDLPTESELGVAMMEAAKQNAKVGELDTKTVFPFWAQNHKTNVVSDKTGAVKPKAALGKLNTGDVMADWEDFLSKQKTDGAKPATSLDGFGTVVVKSHAQKPDTKSLVGSIKALKTTTVKGIDGKATTKTEELGIGKVEVKSNAANPGKGDHTGIVKPKEAMGKQNVPTDYLKGSKTPTQMTPTETKVYKSYDETIKPIKGGSFADYTEKEKLPDLKKHSTVVSDKTGAVKPKSALGK